MVEGGTALGVIVEDTSGVMLEVEGVGLNGDGDGSGHKSLLEGLGVVVGDLLDGDNVDVGVSGAGVSASLVDGLVRVVSLEGSVVRLQVVEGGGLVSTVATEGKLDAIDEELLGEGEELTRFDLPSALKSTGGGEGPAGSALSLILDGGDGTKISPVDGGDGGVERSLHGLSGEVVHGGDVSEHLLVLSVGVGGEHVVVNSPGGTGVVVLLNEGVLLSEAGHSEFEFLDGGVGFAVLGNPLHEVSGEHILF